MPGPQHRLPGGSLLAGDLLLSSRDQIIEGDTGDAGPGRKGGKKGSGLSRPSTGSYLPGLATGPWVSQGGVSLPHCKGEAR